MRRQPALGLLLQHIWKLFDNSGAEGKKEKLHKHLVLGDLSSFRGLFYNVKVCFGVFSFGFGLVVVFFLWFGFLLGFLNIIFYVRN